MANTITLNVKESLIQRLYDEKLITFGELLVLLKDNSEFEYTPNFWPTCPEPIYHYYQYTIPPVTCHG